MAGWPCRVAVEVCRIERFLITLWAEPIILLAQMINVLLGLTVASMMARELGRGVLIFWFMVLSYRSALCERISRLGGRLFAVSLIVLAVGLIIVVNRDVCVGLELFVSAVVACVMRLLSRMFDTTSVWSVQTIP